MQMMMVRTNQLLHIIEAPGSQVHQQRSGAEIDGRAKKVSRVTETISQLIYNITPDSTVSTRRAQPEP